MLTVLKIFGTYLASTIAYCVVLFLFSSLLILVNNFNVIVFFCLILTAIINSSLKHGLIIFS
jgi:hypothetical protein